MGGAERNARKKTQEQQAAKAVAAARGANADRTKVFIGIAIVAVLAVVVVGGVIWSKSSSSETTLTPPSTVSGVSAPVTREGGTVVVGKDSAKVTIDVYEDFLCPICGTFKETYGAQMKQEIEKGTLRVRYRALPYLIRMSSPEGYSRDSANAVLCAADQGKYWEYHDSLFAKQPEEGGPGYTKEELVKLGTDLGVTDPKFKTCVDTDANVKDAQAELDKVRNADFFGGTPTVVADGKKIDWRDKNWLANLVK